MKEAQETREQLIAEMAQTRQRIAELEQLVAHNKVLEEKLTVSETRYRRLFETALDGIIIIDASTEFIIDVNPFLIDMLGYSHKEFLGKQLWEIGPFRDIEASKTAFQELQSKEYVRYEHLPIETKGGKPISVEFVSNVYTVDHKRVIQCNIRDITDRRRAEESLAKSRGELEIRVKERTAELAEANRALVLEMEERAQAKEALRQSEEKYRTLFESAAEGILITDTETMKFKYANPAICIMLGYSQEELTKMEAGDIHPKTSSAQVLAEFGNQARGEKTLTTLPCLKKDGTIIYANINAARAIIDGRECNVGFFTDITERKKMEEELQKIDKLESVGTLAGGIAHDFNNLLTGILGNISLTKRYVEEKGEAFDRLVEAENASLRARDLTQQLLTFARGGAPIKKLVSMVGVIKESATLALTGSNIRSDFDLPDDLWAVEVDEGQMSQVINNVVINAVQAMPQGGVVNISARNFVINKKGPLPLPKGNYIEVTIDDHGIGMPKKHLDRMFEPYFTTKQKGSGLGLATTYSIVKNHGGHITIKSTPTVGTTVNVFLPAVKKRVSKQRGEEAVQTSLLSQGRVLVMDDEDIIRLLLRKILTGTGYEVELSKDGAEAVELYRKARESGQPFDAVILDLTVPGGMGGKESIKKILEIDSEAKVIVSSGYATDPIMSEYKKYGFSAVVAKPYSVSQMEETLHNVLANK